MPEYRPEAGQMCFGQPPQQIQASNLLIAALREIERVMERVYWNKEQEQMESPFGNTGNRWECNTFQVHAYSWGDEEQPWNFRWKDVLVSWYKYLGRGTSVNKVMTPDEIEVMLESCLQALEKIDNEPDRSLM